MSGLVTDAAIEAVAAELVRQQSSGHCVIDSMCQNCDCNSYTDTAGYARQQARASLELAAPLIAAEALRQAERRIAERWETAEKGPEWLEGLARGALIVQKCIDELEGE